MKRLLLPLLLSSCAAPSIALSTNESSRALTVEAWAVGLARRNDPERIPRRDAIAAAVAATDADAVCLTEIVFDDDVDAVVTAAKPRFPFHVHQVFDRRTATDDRGLDGAVVPMPTTPPCSESDAAAFDTGLACVQSKCARADGTFTNECRMGCIPDTIASRCESCLVHGVDARPLDAVRAPCFADARGELALEGRVEVLLLSKHPLRDARVVPTLGTGARAGVALAIADTDQGPVGLACLQIPRLGAGIMRGPFLPPPGFPANNAFTEFGLQAVRLIEAVYGMKVPTVVFGQPQFAWQVAKSGKLLGVCAFSGTFVSNFTLVTSPELEPLTYCTECNPKDAEPRAGLVLEMILLHGATSFETTFVERTHLDKTLVLDGSSVWPSQSGAGLRVGLRF